MKKLLLTLTLALTLVSASAAHAATITVNFNIDHFGGAAGAAPYGSVTLTDIVGGVQVDVLLFNGNRFVDTGFDGTFAWNLTGNQVVTITDLTAGWDVTGGSPEGPALQPDGLKMNGFGEFEYSVNSPGNGGGDAVPGILNFKILGTGLTVLSFVETSSGGDPAAYFAADIIGTQFTGAIGVTGTPRVEELCTNPSCETIATPEPASLLLLGTGLALAAMRLRRRKSA